jgi:hypothetical protein
MLMPAGVCRSWRVTYPDPAADGTHASCVVIISSEVLDLGCQKSCLHIRVWDGETGAALRVISDNAWMGSAKLITQMPL